MMKINNLSLKIPGRLIVSFPLSLTFMPFMILPVALQEANPGQQKLFWNWVLASSIGIIPSAVIYLVAGKIYFHKDTKETFPIWTVSIFGLGLGLLKGFFTGYTSWKLGLLDSYPWDEITIRSVNAGFIGMVFIPAVSILANSFMIFSNSRRKLIEQYLSHEIARLESENISDSLKAKLSTKIDSHLVKILKDAKLKLGKNVDQELEWQKIAEVLRDTATTAVRPLSHELWKSHSKNIRMGIFDYLKLILTIIQFNPAWVISLYTLTTVQYLESASSFNLFLINILLKDLLLFLILSVGRIFRNLLQESGGMSFLKILAPVLIFHFLGTWLINGITGHQNSIFSLGDTIWVAILILQVGILKAFLTTQVFEINQLEKLASKAQLSEIASRKELDRFSREIAKYLHGTMQSRLMAAAMSLENAAKTGSKKSLEEQIDLALESLEMPSLAYLSKGNLHTHQSFEEIVGNWTGILEISTKVSKEASKFKPETIPSVSEVIDEALANAFRHGHASKIKISVYINTNSKIEIEVVDDGVGPREGSFGMGSQLFSSVSSNWSLKMRDNSSGAVLQVELSLLDI